MTYPSHEISTLLIERKIEWVLRAYLPGILANLAASWGPSVGTFDAGAFFSPPREIHHTSLRGVTIGDDALWQATPVVCVSPESSAVSGQQNNTQTDAVDYAVEVYTQCDGVPFSAIPGLSRAYCAAVIEALVRHLPDATTSSFPCTGVYMARLTQSAVGEIIRVGDLANMVTARAGFELQRRMSLTTGRTIADSLATRPHWPAEVEDVLADMASTIDAAPLTWSPFVRASIPVGAQTLVVSHPTLSPGSTIRVRRQALPPFVAGVFAGTPGAVSVALDISSLTVQAGTLTATVQDAVTGATVVYTATMEV